MQAFGFEETLQFIKNWASLGLSDEHLQLMQIRLMKNPEEGAVIPGDRWLSKTANQIARAW